MTSLTFAVTFLLASICPTAAITCGDFCNAPVSTECSIVVQNTLRFDQSSEYFFECILDPNELPGSDQERRVPIRMSLEQKEQLQSNFESGEIVSESSTLVFGESDYKISSEGVFVPPSLTTFAFGAGDDSRRLATVEGDKPFLVVKVTDSQGRQLQDSTDEISDQIFGTFGDELTLKSQMDACSFGKVDIISGNGDQHESSPGVIEVTITKSLVGYGRNVIMQAVTQETEALLGHSLPGPYTNVMYLLEACYSDCGWLSYAHVNSWLSVYQGEYYKYAGVQMHAIGQNFNLGPSGGLNGGSYGDHTGLMGFPPLNSDAGAMCYNAAKSYQLGWYDDKAVAIDPTTQGLWMGEIIGIADFGNNPEGLPVVLKIESESDIDHFIAFNRASGINKDNAEADDEITIVEAGENGSNYSPSLLKATLQEGEVYTIPDWNGGSQNLTIIADTININTGTQPGYARITVCLDSFCPIIAPSPYPKLGEVSHYAQLGSDIDGNSNNDNFGKSVAVSDDGSRVAVAASGELNSDNSMGVVRVFDWDANNSQWTQIGGNIVGSSESMSLGYAIDMNSDGSRLVIGAANSRGDDGIVFVYELDENDQWQLLGSEINGLSGMGGWAGYSVVMNSSGNIIAFSSPRTPKLLGWVEAFQFVNGAWIRMGDGFNSNEEYSYFGGSIAMSADGQRIVVGVKYGVMTGSVHIYDFDGSQWQEQGTITGRYYYDFFGGDVDISDDGSRIIVGAPSSDGFRRPNGVFNAGEFQVFEFKNSAWTLIGQKIIGSAPEDEFGQAVSISGDGTHISISSPLNDEAGANAGKVEVYRYSESDDQWILEGQSILGESSKDKFGAGGAVALDYTGAHLIVGAMASTYSTGMARVFTAVEA